MHSLEGARNQFMHREVIQVLRQEVLLGSIPAGTIIDESVVSAQYGFEIADSRIAIEALVARRLLRRERNGVVRVALIPAEDVDDIYRSRELIERECIRRLAANRKAPKVAREANNLIRGLVRSDPIDVVGPDMNFHISLIEAAGSTRVTMMFRSLADEVRLCMAQVQGAALLPTRLIVDEHEAILRHIDAGDVEQATVTIRRHLSRARERLVSHIVPPR